MSLTVRMALYVGGGAAILTWIAPPDGLPKVGLILGLIVASAYLDRVLTRRARKGVSAGGVVSLGTFRNQREQKGGAAAETRGRRIPRLVFSTRYQSDAETLREMLRGAGLNPVLVMQNRGGAAGTAAPVYEIRVVEAELKQARPLIDQFLARSLKKPS
ncbi:MAG: hypothetical protein HY423_12405 [Candidatus Lambdaproteobacteria bacterium]|nr:hypothetical protein [Candidatus Lambdaproteobacteria bacterium]